jgi:hypothetical protein
MNTNQQLAEAAPAGGHKGTLVLKLQMVADGGVAFNLDADCPPGLLLIGAHGLLQNCVEDLKPKHVAAAREALSALESVLGSFEVDPVH